MRKSSDHAANWMSDEHLAYRDMLARFFAEELTPNLERWRKSRQIDREFWNKAGAQGILGATMPEDYGGVNGARSLDAVTILEQGRAGDSCWGFGIHNFVMHYILNYGSEAQRTRWLPGMATGDLVAALAMTEPGTGSDLQRIKTAARKIDGRYVINGSKTFITNGQHANLICLVARTGDGGHGGISLFMIETDGLKGFRRGRNLEKLGQKAQDTAELYFDDVEVEEEALLGGVEGRGFYQMMEQLPWERLSVGLVAIGACELAISLTLDYVRQRTAFGKSVFDFQNTRFKLAEAQTKLAVSRAFVDDCIEKLDRGALDVAEAAMAKWWLSQIQCEIMDECVQLHGGYGYMDEYQICRLYADARVQKIYGGTNEIMKELIARAL